MIANFNSRPITTFLGLVLSLPSAGAAAQMQHAPPPPPKSATQALVNDLPCHAIRITQIAGGAENYSYTIKDRDHPSKPEPKTFTLKTGQSKIIEAEAGQPFPLAPGDLLTLNATPVGAPSANPPLVYDYLEGGSALNMLTYDTNDPFAHDAMVIGPPTFTREVIIGAPNCSPAQSVLDQTPWRPEPPDSRISLPELAQNASRVSRVVKFITGLGESTAPKVLAPEISLGITATELAYEHIRPDLELLRETWMGPDAAANIEQAKK